MLKFAHQAAGRENAAGRGVGQRVRHARAVADDEQAGTAGLEPLVIVAPLSGDYYDWVGVDAHARQSCYERILNIADKYGAKVADFTDREYERYFLHDMVHFGWTGWVDVDQALYEFAKGV